MSATIFATNLFCMSKRENLQNKRKCFFYFTLKALFVLEHADLDKPRWLFYYTSNVSSLLQKFHFPKEVVLNSLETQNNPELDFRPQVLYNILMKYLLL